MRPALLIALLLAFTTTLQAFSIQDNKDRVFVIAGPIGENTLVPAAQGMLKLIMSDELPGIIDLVIDSPGGRVDVGLQLIVVMKQFQRAGGIIRCTTATTAASMAFHIFLHCDERHSLQESRFLWHRVRINVGGLFGEPMTYLNATVLARQLRQMDNHIFADLRRLIPGVSRSTLLYHFDNETLHMATQLKLLSPKFLSVHESIGNLIESLLGVEVKNPAQPAEQKQKPTTTQKQDTSASRRGGVGPDFIYQLPESAQKRKQ